VRQQTLSFLNHKSRLAKFSFFLLPLFFIYFADAVLSYTFPIIAEKQVGSNTLLGIVMSLSSVAGILCDFTFPTFFRGTTWRFQMMFGILLAVLFPISIHISIFFLPFFFSLFASIVWGIYYEALMFSQQDLVVAEETPKEYARSWGILYALTLIGSVVGPLLGAQLLLRPIVEHTAAVLVLQCVALLLALTIIWYFKKEHDEERHGHQKFSIIKLGLECVRNLKRWEILSLAIFPAIIMGITTEWIEASYWTLGGLFGEAINTANPGLSWTVVMLYSLPFIFGSIILARLNVTTHKKHWSQLALLAGGIILSTIFLTRVNIILLYVVIAVSSFFFAFATPLNDAVYSDLIARFDGNKLALVGLAKANSSLAYIIAPIVMGMVADRSDYYATFGIIGIMAVVVAIILLIITPRKLRLPEKEIAHVR
jgi:MFS family permease